jgi:hypothetical protein
MKCTEPQLGQWLPLGQHASFESILHYHDNNLCEATLYMLPISDIMFAKIVIQVVLIFVSGKAFWLWQQSRFLLPNALFEKLNRAVWLSGPPATGLVVPLSRCLVVPVLSSPCGPCRLIPFVVLSSHPIV